MIRLLTVVGHGLELLPHFIQHYKNDVDEINIIVYSNEKSTTFTKFLCNFVIDKSVSDFLCAG